MTEEQAAEMSRLLREIKDDALSIIAERDRYREALKQMAGPCSFKFTLDKDCGYCVQCIANNALKAGNWER